MIVANGGAEIQLKIIHCIECYYKTQGMEDLLYLLEIFC